MEQRKKKTKINDCKLQANKYRYNNHFTNKSKKKDNKVFFSSLHIDVLI